MDVGARWRAMLFCGGIEAGASPASGLLQNEGGFDADHGRRSWRTCRRGVMTRIYSGAVGFRWNDEQRLVQTILKQA